MMSMGKISPLGEYSGLDNRTHYSPRNNIVTRILPAPIDHGVCRPFDAVQYPPVYRAGISES
jgi:hypothetical protein